MNATNVTNITTDLKSRSLSRTVWRYCIVAEKLYRPELGEYHTYGIQATSAGYTDTLHDVSVCPKTAEGIVALLNHYQVSPVHLQDVVMDMLP